MLAMRNRQAQRGAGTTASALIVVFWMLTACRPSPTSVATATLFPSPALWAPTLPPAPAPPPSPTPSPQPVRTETPCLDQSGRLESGSLETGGLLPVPLRYQVYLPPCYAPDARQYPLLILFHGQGYDEAQWLRLGADRVADRLALEGQPFLILLPYDPYARQASEFPLDRARLCCSPGPTGTRRRRAFARRRLGHSAGADSS